MLSTTIRLVRQRRRKKSTTSPTSTTATQVVSVSEPMVRTMFSERSVTTVIFRRPGSVLPSSFTRAITRREVSTGFAPERRCTIMISAGRPFIVASLVRSSIPRCTSAMSFR